NIAKSPTATLHGVFAMIRDKDPGLILPILQKDAYYYCCHVAMPRALPAEELRSAAADHGLVGDAYATVGEALTAARRSASAADLIFIGGSTFIVADALGAEDFRQYPSA